MAASVSCKGKSDRAVASNVCYRRNAGKGRERVSMADKKCKGKGGKIEKGRSAGAPRAGGIPTRVKPAQSPEAASA
jgi:hypothetical protein